LIQGAPEDVHILQQCQQGLSIHDESCGCGGKCGDDGKAYKKAKDGSIKHEEICGKCES